MSTVSIIIPTYNRSTLLRRAINSALAQTYADCEIIVIDDGSTDDTAQVAASYASTVHYIQQQNAGVSAARNAGATRASGEFLLFLDSDDRLRPNAVSALMGTLGPFPQAGIAYAQAALVDLQENELGVIKPSFNRPPGQWSGPRELVHLLLQNYMPTSTIMVRRGTFQACQGFDKARGHIAEDWDLWTRIAQRANVCYVPLLLAEKTQQEISLSAVVDDASRQQFLVNHWQIIARTMSDPRVQAQPDLNEARVQAAYLFHSARLAYAQHDLKTAHQDMAQAVRMYPKILLDRELDEAASLWLKLRLPSGVISSIRALKRGNM